MRTKLLRILLTALCIVSFNTLSFSAITKPLVIKATVPLLTQALTLTTAKIDSKGTADSNDDTWGPGVADGPIDFANLVANTQFNIFTNVFYYAVDCGVLDNSGTVWTLTHARTSLQRDATNNLNSNINVSFNRIVKIPDPTDPTQIIDKTTPLSKFTFGLSGAKAFTKTQLFDTAEGKQGWLRIFYGLATGDPAVDATGAAPIPLDKASGLYQGSITISLTP